jgi:hypothetical protein
MHPPPPLPARRLDWTSPALDPAGVGRRGGREQAGVRMCRRFFSPALPPTAAAARPSLLLLQWRTSQLPCSSSSGSSHLLPPMLALRLCCVLLYGCSSLAGVAWNPPPVAPRGCPPAAALSGRRSGRTELPLPFPTRGLSLIDSDGPVNRLRRAPAYVRSFGGGRASSWGEAEQDIHRRRTSMAAQEASTDGARCSGGAVGGARLCGQAAGTVEEQRRRPSSSPAANVARSGCRIPPEAEQRREGAAMVVGMARAEAVVGPAEASGSPGLPHIPRIPRGR